MWYSGINAYGTSASKSTTDHREKLYVHNMMDERKAQETKMMHARQEQQNALEEAQVHFSFVLFFFPIPKDVCRCLTDFAPLYLFHWEIISITLETRLPYYHISIIILPFYSITILLDYHLTRTPFPEPHSCAGRCCTPVAVVVVGVLW